MTRLPASCRRNWTVCVSALSAKPVTLATMPPDLKRDWVLPDGRARIQVMPKTLTNVSTEPAHTSSTR